MSKAKKAGNREVRSTRIEKADNGFAVHKQYEPTGDPQQDYADEKPSVFSGPSALADAHNFSAQCHGGDCGSPMGAAPSAPNGAMPASGDAAA